MRGAFAPKRGVLPRAQGRFRPRGAAGAEKRGESTRRGAKSVIFAPQKPIGCEVSEIRTWSVRKEILPLPYGRPRSQTQGSGAGSERTARSSPFMVTDHAPPPCAHGQQRLPAWHAGSGGTFRPQGHHNITIITP